MKTTIHPGRLNGSVIAPASKSSTQRALAASLVAGGKTILHHPGSSHDELAALEIIQGLGAKVEKGKEEWIIESSGVDPISPMINAGESGLAVRMFSCLAALSEKEMIISGQGTLLERPMNFFDEVFPSLAIKVKGNNGYLPMTIKGPMLPANITVDGSISSQFLTGLLMAYSASSLNEQVSIKVMNLKSKPYIDLTLDVMKQFGLPLPENRNYQEFIFKKNIYKIPDAGQTRNYKVETDWSNGAFLLVAGAIAGPVTVRGLDLTSSQADKAIIDVLMEARAGIAIDAKGIIVHPSEMKAFNFDATNCPDLFPPLVALACYCKGETTIKGVSRLLNKESNRSEALQQEFMKIGIDITVDADMMMIRGGKVKAATVHSHHDHRIAMSLAVAALGAEGDIIIEEATAVKKSYPGFFEDLKKLGASVSLSFHQFNF